MLSFLTMMFTSALGCADLSVLRWLRFLCASGWDGRPTLWLYLTSRVAELVYIPSSNVQGALLLHLFALSVGLSSFHPPLFLLFCFPFLSRSHVALPGLKFAKSPRLALNSGLPSFTFQGLGVHVWLLFLMAGILTIWPWDLRAACFSLMVKGVEEFSNN